MTKSTPTIYADYQATTPVDRRVVEQMNRYWTDSFGNPHSNNHVVGWAAARRIDGCQNSVSRLIGADPDEIIFTSGATESNNLALLGLTRPRTSRGNTVLVSDIEHKCVLASSRFLHAECGIRVKTIPVNEKGLVDLVALEDLIDDSVILASIMAVNNEIGTIQPIEEISDLLRRKGVIFHCDAAQAPCAMDTTDLAQQADLISLSSHKIYGPQGIGALYVSRHLQGSLHPIIHGGGQQNGLRSGTLPLPLCVGMATAAELLPDVRERTNVAKLRNAFLNTLFESEFEISLNGPPLELRHPGNANLSFDGFEAEDILTTLQPRLAASAGSACSTGLPEPSHVLTAIGLPVDLSNSSIRFSFGRFSTIEEIRDASRIVLEGLTSIPCHAQ